MNHSSQSVATPHQTDLTTSAPIGSLARGSMFWQPDYLQFSAWLEYLPALFWLVEAVQPKQCVTLGVHQGAAHFAVCQAVSRLQLDARCYGIQPRSALSEQDAERYHAVQEYHSRHYSGISRLVDTAPQEGLGQFSRGSIDLLVFNLPPDTANAAPLVEMAISRLSTCGVLVLPHIESREPGMRLHDVFETLAQRYPTFAFVHGDGMGVVAVGSAPTATLKSLLDASDAPASRKVLRDVFQRLGRSCADGVSAQQERQRADRLSGELRDISAEHQRLAAERDSLSEQLTQQQQSNARELGQLEARAGMLQELREELQVELKQLRGQERVTAQPAPDVIALADDNSHEETGSAVQEDAGQAVLEAQLEEAQDSLATRFKELAHLTRLLEEQRSEAEQAKTERDAAQQALSAAEERAEEKAKAKIDVKEAERQQSDERQALQQQLNESQASLQIRFEELTTLTQMLEESEQQREVLADQLAKAPQQTVEASTSAPQPMTPLPADPADAVTVAPSPYHADPKRLAQDAEWIRQSGWFDTQWYLEHYQDIAKHERFSKTPAQHYLLYGGYEGRNPGPEFDSAFYLRHYPDVREGGENPLVHFLTHGLKEQRQPR